MCEIWHWKNQRNLERTVDVRPHEESAFWVCLDEHIYPAPETPDEDLPSFYQFEYYYRKDRDIKTEVEKREGTKEYEKNVRPVTGDSTRMAFGPGMVYQIDATVGDIYLVSHLDRTLLIGKPVIYIVIDVFSRLIVGFAVTLEGPSWEGAKLALECAFLNKVEFCKKYGVDITQDMWDVEGRCEALLGDNGEIAGYNPDSLVDPLDTRVANTPTDRPDLKGIVENKFLLVKETVVWIPGAVRPPRRVRGKDYRLEAVLDLNQFRALMIECILFYNNHRYLKKYRMDKQMIADKVKPIPRELWAYGMKHRSGRLREADPDVIRLNLQHRGEASVTEEGIRFQGLHFTCERAMREQWFTRVKGRRVRHVEVVRGSLVDTIHLRLDKGKCFEECVLTDADKRFEGCDWYDVAEYFALKDKAAAEAEAGLHQSAAEYHAKADRIVSEAKEMTKAALAGTNLSNNERTSGIRENRKRHKAYERRQGGTKPNSDTNQVLPVPLPIPVPKSPAPAGYVPPAHPHNELRAARERVKKYGKR
jgi:putative transposase